MKSKILILLLLFIICSIQLTAQTITKSEDGKTYFLYEDGTWSEEITDINNCKELIKEVTTTKTKGFMSVNPIKISNQKTYLTIELIKNEDVTVIDMKVTGDNICFGPKDMATFTTVDDTEIKLNFSSSISNCKGEFSLFFGEPFKNQKTLSDLVNKQIKSLTLSKHHYNVNEYEANLFQNTLKCLNKIK